MKMYMKFMLFLALISAIGCSGSSRTKTVVNENIKEVEPVIRKTPEVAKIIKEQKQCYDNSVVLSEGGQCSHTLQFARHDQQCLLNDTGKLTCWGGDAETPESKKKSEAVFAGLKGKVILIKEGCLLTDANEVRCIDLPGAIDFGPDFEVKDLAVGASVYCALSKKGQVKCIGLNDVGQLASGDTTNRLTLSKIPAIDFGHESSVTKVWYGRRFGIAQFADGKIKGWGQNTFHTLVNSDGKIGTADDNIGDAADEVEAGMPFIDFGNKGGTPLVLKDVALIRAGACYLFERGTIKCYGDNQFGAVGVNVRNTFSGEVDLGTGFVANKIYGDFTTFAPYPKWVR